MNIWKTITIVLLFIACLLFIIWYNDVYNAKADLKAFQIPKLQYDALMSAVGNQEQVQICSIDEGKCVTLRKVGG